MKWKIRISLLVILAVLLSSSACGGTKSDSGTASGTGSVSLAEGPAKDGQTGADGTAAETSGDKAAKKTLTIAIQDEIEGADIQQIGWSNVVHALIYQPLVTFSEDLSEIQPAFAESVEVAKDGSYIEFVLPADAKFSNGDVCDAAAVKASAERFIQISEYADDLAAVERIEVVNEQTLRYNLSEPAPYIWASLASNYGGIVHAGVASAMADDAFNRSPVANGPFYVAEWAQGSQIVLKKNPYFSTNNPQVKNKGPVDVDEIIVRFIPDQFTRVSELESGNIDIIFDVPTANIADLEANPALSTYRYLQSGVSYLNLQTGKDVTADPLVRQAITYAVNREELADVLDHVVTPMYGFISAAQAGFSQTEEDKLAKTLAFNPDQAKSLLAEAGWSDSNGDGLVEKDGQTCALEILVTSDRATVKNCAPVLQQQLISVGIDASLREYESSYIKQLMKEDNFVVGTRSFSWSDADILYYVFTEASGYPWSDPAVTAALTAARAENDPQARVAKYAEAQHALQQTFKAVSLFSDHYCVAAKSTVGGLVITQDGRTWVNDLKLDQ